MTMTRLLIAITLSFAVAAHAQTPRKRALLIGIDDYSASAIPGAVETEHRGWPDLKGAANDAGILREMLVHVYGFRPDDIVVLKNQQATRAAILAAIEEHLVRRAAKGDIVFYFFAGHGSQVPNAASDEPDGLDESIVPADSRRGALDIRDKELRPLFNRILDRGAHLTLLLDHCHSGSGFRGMPSGAHPRGIRPAPALADGGSYGSRPEERGALVLASAQDADRAWETRGEDGAMHGAFTWAWIRAIRDAPADEPAQETFLRAQARLRVEHPDQTPAMLGTAAARLRPFLAARRDRRGDRTVVAIERVQANGDVVLQGGWANGLTLGTELRVTTTRLRIAKILGPGRSLARVEKLQAVTRTSQPTTRHSQPATHNAPPAIRTGALAEVVAWAAGPRRPLRIWTPRAAVPTHLPRTLANATRAEWVLDPLERTPSHVLRPHGDAWKLLGDDGASRLLRDDATAVAAVARLGPRTSLFVQFPASPELLAGIGTGLGIVHADDGEEADYILAGRHAAGRIEYAWVRANVGSEDHRQSGLPVRSAWTDSPLALRDALLKLRRIHAWHMLESPPATPSPYHLALRHESSGRLGRDDAVIGGEIYSAVLRSTDSTRRPSAPRYYYVFVIDSDGRSYLVFPRAGSVENRFPLRGPAPATIPLDGPHAFRITRPYGIDTYFLLSTDEPLPNPSILAWDGVRAAPSPRTDLEELLLLTITGTRSTRPLRPGEWSLERVTFESVAPRFSVEGHASALRPTLLRAKPYGVRRQPLRFPIRAASTVTLRSRRAFAFR